MKNKRLNLLSIVLLCVMLFIMYGTNIGVPGITQYWSGFKLFDMQLLYSVDTFKETLSKIGMDGIRHYLYYFAVDFGFILTLFWVQYEITESVTKGKQFQCKIILVFAMMRGLLDIVEDILLALLLKEKISVTVVPIASFITSLKFCCLFGWIILVLFLAIRNRKKEHST
ncbi:MAG: hypothetical protein Q4F05_18855 [bacterium]|nr:hypothetical protein [bacterium]